MLRDTLEAASAEYPAGRATTDTPDSPEAFGRALIAEAVAAALQVLGAKDAESLQLTAQVTFSRGEAPTALGRCPCVRLTRDLWVCTCIKPALD